MIRQDTDEYSLISWLESQSLEAHNEAARIRSQPKYDERKRWYQESRETFANEVLAHIRNSHTTELHRKLMEK